MSERVIRDGSVPDVTDAQRQLARTLYVTFVALRDAGFSESQAMAIVVGVASGAGNRDDESSPSA